MNVKKILIGVLLVCSIIAYAQTTATLDLSGTIPTSIQVSLDGASAGGSYNYDIGPIGVDGTFAAEDTGYDLYYMSNAPACTVSITSLNADATDFRLSNGTEYIPYILSVGSYNCNVGTNTPINADAAAYVWTAPAGGSAILVSNAVSVVGLPAGVYVDTLTFTITAP